MSHSTRGVASKRLRCLVLLLAAPAFASCSGGSNSTPEQTNETPTTQASTGKDDVEPGQQAANTVYSTTFKQPFEVKALDWMSAKPSVEQRNFITWETPASDKAVRFMLPVSVYPPGRAGTAPVPPDYITYLLSQRGHGARLSDPVTARVAGHPTTLVTATTNEPMDGSLGCQMKGLTAPECFGLQPDVTLRIAVIDLNGRTLLAWMRNNRPESPDLVATDVRQFEQMLNTLRFSDRAPDTTITSTTTPIDGIWRTQLTLAQLEKSPLLMGPWEINDGNWGTFTLSFDRGQFAEKQRNPQGTYAASGTFTIEEDILTINRDNGEHFVMRWSTKGDQLNLQRDKNLGIAPTPFVVRPWTRQAER